MKVGVKKTRSKRVRIEESHSWNFWKLRIDRKTRLRKMVSMLSMHDIDSLFSIVGAQLYYSKPPQAENDILYVFPNNPNNANYYIAIEKGKMWFNDNKYIIQSYVCKNKRLNSASEIDFAVTTADIILNIINNLNPIISCAAALIIFKYGINLFCSNFEEYKPGKTKVKGYYRKNGKYIKTYYRGKTIHKAK